MRRTIGLVILLLGLAVCAYGAVGFWVYNNLPPNDEFNGRSPSLYVIFGGMAGMLLGAAVRGLRLN